MWAKPSTFTSGRTRVVLQGASMEMCAMVAFPPLPSELGTQTPLVLTQKHLLGLQSLRRAIWAKPQGEHGPAQHLRRWRGAGELATGALFPEISRGRERELVMKTLQSFPAPHSVFLPLCCACPPPHAGLTHIHLPATQQTEKLPSPSKAVT